MNATPAASPPRPVAPLARPVIPAELSPAWDQPLASAAGTPDVGARATSTPEPFEPASNVPADRPHVVALRDAFTPRQPKRWRHLFVGRARQIERALSALEVENAHIVLYGERGRGKTSLANVIAEFAAERGYAVVRCAGSAELTFDTVFRQLLDRIALDQTDLRATSTRSISALAPSPLTVGSLTDIVRHVNRGRFLLVIDEFDRITDPAMRRQVAETIKNLSDIQARVALMIVGVATSLDALLGAHPSIQRAIVGIHVPLMTPGEVEHLISTGAEAAGIAFEASAVRYISDLARGLPYFVQLLGLYAARSAVERKAGTVEGRDVIAAAEAVLEETEPAILGAFERATRRCTPELLHALATAQSDPFGAFTHESLRAALPRVTEADLRLIIEWLSSEAGGNTLVSTAHSGRSDIAFQHSTMRQYVLLREFVRRTSPRPVTRP